MPRAAILSLHARVEGIGADVLDDPSLIQLWGPRYSAFTIAAVDLPYFSLARLPDGGKALERAERVAASLADFLGDRRMGYGEAGEAMGVPHNRLRYAAPTGTVVMKWEGARQPQIWIVPKPEVDPLEARAELARRYLHVYGPTGSESYSNWAGITSRQGAAAFSLLGDETVAVASPIGEAVILAEDEESFRAGPGPEAPARLLPSGDAYFLLQGDDRALLVPDQSLRELLWTSRVWPGAVLVNGEIVGTWRRDQAKVSIDLWHALGADERRFVEDEAASLPLPGLDAPAHVAWQ
jgi:hypothetical protein